MSFVGKTGLAVLSLIVLMCMGCDQIYRPVANPILGPGGDPGATRGALVVENNGGGVGATDLVNTGGDTLVGVITTGANPSYGAILASNSLSAVANQGEDSVLLYTTFLPSNPGVFVSLPAGSQPVFLATTQSTVVYVAEAGTGKVGAITTAGVLGAESSVGGTPVALAETPDQTHLYAVLSGGSVADLVPGDFTVAPVSIGVGANPVFAAASADSKLVFVVNQGGNSVSVIDTASDTVVQTIPVGPSPNFAKYDANRKRVYVTNSGGSTVSVIDASGTVPFPAPVTVTVGGAPTSVTALADGSRAYVANSASGTVSVINAGSLTVVKTIPVGTTPLSIASSADSARVIVANRDTVNSGSAIIGSITDITTTTDTVVNTFLPARSNPILVVTTH